MCVWMWMHVWQERGGGRRGIRISNVYKQTNKQTNKKQHYKAKRKKSKSWHFRKSNPRLLLFTSNRSLLRQDVASMHVCTQRVGYGINRLWGT